MTNIASVLRTEVSRLARKEVRAELEGLKKANAQHRSAIAELRRELAALQKQLKQFRLQQEMLWQKPEKKLDMLSWISISSVFLMYGL